MEASSSKAATNGDHSEASRNGGNGGLVSPPFTPLQPRKSSDTTTDETSAMKKAKVPWTPEEDEILRKAVEMYKGRAWKQVAELLPGRTHSQAAHRWQKVLDPKLKKGTWTQEEDDQLQKAVEDLGEGHWSRVAERVGSRNGKQCRERWRNQISPEVDKRPWMPEEDEGIIRLFTELGPKWAEIAKHFPGRTENAVKNRWNAKLGRPNGSSSSTGGSPATPNPSKRHASNGSALSSRASTVASETPKRGSRGGGRDARTRSSAATSAASPATPLQYFPLVPNGLSGGLGQSALNGNGHHPVSPMIFTNGTDAGKLRSSPSSAFASVDNGLPPLPSKRPKVASDNQQIDATQALLALRAGASPGW